MNNKEYIGELSRRLGYTNKDAARLVTSFVDIAKNELLDGKTLVIPNFGTFKVKKKSERISINPVTRQRMLIPPKLTLTYKPSMTLKDKLKNDSPNE